MHDFMRMCNLRHKIRNNKNKNKLIDTENLGEALDRRWVGGTEKRAKVIKKDKWIITKWTWRYKVQHMENSY